MKSYLNIMALACLLAITGCKSKQTATVSEKPEQAVAKETDGKKKNILFIAVDDLKPLLNSYGESQMITPNFDRLAKMGVSFTNAHVQYAVCGPSRASVMTGTYPDRTKVWDLHTNFRESAPELISMPEYLISQGYETTAVGKIYHKGSSSPGHDGKSWSINHKLAKDEDYPEKYGAPAYGFYQNPETKKRMEALTEEAKSKGKTKNGQIRSYVLKRFRPSTEMADVDDNAYMDGVYTEIAIKKLDRLMKTGKPWFLGVGYQRPHLPFVAPKKYWDLYDRDKVKLAEFQQLAEGTPMLAYHSFGELRAYSDIDDNYNIGDIINEDKQRELVHGYMAAVSYIDAQLGILLDTLESKGILDDTVIVLWGDHGWHLGDHTEWCKHSNFEQATRIPFMFAGPGVSKDQKVDNPVALLDLFPTVFELANVPQSPQEEGKSLVPLLDNDANTTITEDAVFHQYARGKRMGYSIRTDKYRYTEWHDNDYRSYKPYKEENIIARELYDYDKDPLETKNHVEDPEYKAIVTQLKAKLKQHLQDYK